MPCTKCADSGWVCENHPDKAFSGVCFADDACSCGGAGMPCECNPMSRDGLAQVLPFRPKKLSGFIPADYDTAPSEYVNPDSA